MSTVSSGRAGPDLESFGEFMRELSQGLPEKKYVWTRAKERSSDWLADRVPPGSAGVDVGGTEYLCERLTEKGCSAVHYDLVPPSRYPYYVQDDMFNVLRHFGPRSLDFVVTRRTLEHSPVPLYQLWAYNKLLKDDGQLLVTVPCYHDTWVWMVTHFAAAPPDSWHMLFFRAGFDVEEFELGSWNPRKPWFVEHRFRLSVASRELRLRGRPRRTLRSQVESLPGGWAPVKGPPRPGVSTAPDAPATVLALQEGRPGRARMVRSWWRPARMARR